MRRIVCLLAGVLLVAPSLGSDTPREYDGATEIAVLEGSWRLTKREIRGETEQLGSIQRVLTFQGGTVTYTGDSRDVKYRIVPNCNPPHLDEVVQGQTLKFIYQIDGDTLRIAWIDGASPVRCPLGFNDVGVIVQTYKRVK
jgi:uncharacterized protein (TIGR03067 family)